MQAGSHPSEAAPEFPGEHAHAAVVVAAAMFVFAGSLVFVKPSTELPPGGTPLAHNDMGLQAAEIRFSNGACARCCPC